MKQCNNIFQRVEKKYLLNEDQLCYFMKILNQRTTPDEYGKTTICNVYYDTPDFQLIRASIEKPPYKEKLRMRSYGIPQKNDPVFLEIKKKLKGVVYKRRVQMTLANALRYTQNRIYTLESSQILREIDYFMDFYHPQPSVFIAYDRVARYGNEDPELRITLDSNIRWRKEDLVLSNGDWGTPLLESGNYLLEIKLLGAMPLWLCHCLDEIRAFPTSYSKYGACYKQNLYAAPLGGVCFG